MLPTKHKSFVTGITNKMILRRFLSTKQVMPNHTSLRSFIDHANATGLDKSSTVYKGTFFEYSVLETLKSHGFACHRTGGTGDNGVDLSGTWHLSPTNPCAVAIQCKHEAKRIGPKYVRELSGIRAPIGTVLMLASSSTFTAHAIQALMASRSPICLLLLEPWQTDEEAVRLGGGTLRQLIWNVAAAEHLGSLEVRLVHSKNSPDAVIKLYYDDKKLSRIKK